MNQIYANNIKALKQIISTEYIQEVEKETSVKWAKLINSKDNTPNLLISTGIQKKSLYPLEGWHKEIDQRIKDIEFKKSTCTLIIGVSLGFFIDEAIKNSHEKHKFVVVEPNPGMLHLAMQNCDFSKALLDQKLFLATTPQDISYMMEWLNEKNVVDNWNVIVEKYTISNPSYQQISYDAINILNQVRCNIGTVTNAGSQIANNDIANLPYVIHRRGVAELTNLYKSKPAILVSTGPSLEKNIHYLIDNQDKAIIIAVGQALRPLLAYGIRPDFICSVDFGEVNLSHYDGLMDTDIPLVSLNRSYAAILKKWKGPVFVSASPFAAPTEGDQKIQHLLSQKGWTIQGGSVAHMCFGLGITLGCDPLIMIGQDLAYDSNKSHCSQADAGGTLKKDESGEVQWEVNDPRSELYKKEYSMGNLITVPGYFLKDVQTNIGLASFITSFERFIKDYGDSINVIDATEGGAYINGTTRMSFLRALEQYCFETIKDKEKILHPLLSNCGNALNLIEQAVSMLKKEKILLNKIVDQCTKALKTNEQMRPFSIKDFNWTEKAKKKFGLIDDKNKKYTNTAYKYVMEMPLVQLAIYGANRAIQTANMMAKGGLDHVIEHNEDFIIRLDRNELILKAARQSAIDLKETYKEVYQILSRVNERKDLSLLFAAEPDSPPNLNDVEDYFAADNFARPLLEAERMGITIADCSKRTYPDPNDLANKANDIYCRALEIRKEAIDKAKSLPDQSDEIDCIQLIYEAQKIGRETKDYTKARDMLEKAVDLYPANTMAIYGLASAYFHTEQYDKSIKLYEILIKKDYSPRCEFELGQVFIYSGDVKNGIEMILSAMNKTEEFNSFLFVLGDILCGQEDYETAIDLYQSYLEKFPADYQVWIKLEKALKKSGNYKEATIAINKAKQIQGGI